MVDFELELTDPERMSERVAFHEQLIAEEKAAEALCEQLLSGPSRWWRNAILQAPGAYSAGTVAVLIARSEKVLPRSPAEAFELVEIALHVAETIAVESYAYDHVLRIRGQALRQKAYVLSFMGEHHQARATADLAGMVLKQIPIAPLELARLDLVRSDIARRMEKFGEAIELAHRAGETYLEFGARQSWIKARVMEAAALFSEGRFAEARDVWRTCEAHFDLLDLSGRAAILHNLAICAAELGEREETASYYSQAGAAFEKLGQRVFSAKCRYGAGKAKLAAGAYAEAIAALKRSWDELEALEARGDAVLPALLLAEALLVTGRTDEVPAICRTLIDRCARSAMPSGAMTALAFLREAVAYGHASPAVVRSIHDYMRDTACGAKQPFRAEIAARFEG